MARRRAQKERKWQGRGEGDRETRKAPVSVQRHPRLVSQLGCPCSPSLQSLSSAGVSPEVWESGPVTEVVVFLPQRVPSRVPDLTHHSKRSEGHFQPQLDLARSAGPVDRVRGIRCVGSQAKCRRVSNATSAPRICPVVEEVEKFGAEL